MIFMSRVLCLFPKTNCTHQLYQKDVFTSRNFKGIVFFGGKQLQSFFFKSVRLFHRTSCSNFCLKGTMLNAEKHLQPSSVNFTTAIVVIHFDIF